jgi:two-component system, NarL family, response regulator DegU
MQMNQTPQLLSPRQHEILLLLAEGKDNKTIARQLGISDKTVKNHLTDVFRKINVESRTQAALWVVRTSGI